MDMKSVLNPKTLTSTNLQTAFVPNSSFAAIPIRHQTRKLAKYPIWQSVVQNREIAICSKNAQLTDTVMEYFLMVMLFIR